MGTHHNIDFALSKAIEVRVPKLVLQVILKPFKAVLTCLTLIVIGRARNVVNRWVVVVFQLNVDIGLLKLRDNIDPLHWRTVEGRLSAVLFIKHIGVQRIGEAKLEAISDHDFHLPSPPMSFSISWLRR